MKYTYRKNYSFIITLFLFISCNLGSMEKPPVDVPGEFPEVINTNENTRSIYNPDQGFYRPMTLLVKDSKITTNGWYKDNLEDGIYKTPVSDDEPFNVNNEYTQLYHLRFDISEYSGKINNESDKELTSEFCENFGKLLEKFKKYEKNVIIRFTYCPNCAWDGSNHDFEPSIEFILKHIETICSVANNYPDVITAIETGLVGGWGEMHGTVSAETPDLVATIVNKYLEQTRSSKIPVLVRRPDIIYSYIYKYKMNGQLDSTQTNNTTPFSVVKDFSTENDAELSRLGLYNDGYLASETDLGTYKSGNRASEIEWLSANVTNSTPFGGEVTDGSPAKGLYKLKNKEYFETVNEMFKMNLSYLNIEFNSSAINEWNSHKSVIEKPYKNKTDLAYMKNRMGYRFLVEESTQEIMEDGKLNCKLKLKNIGFGNFIKRKKVSVILVKDNQPCFEATNISDFTGQDSLNLSFELSSDIINSSANNKPEYEVYLRVDNGDGKYVVQFANRNMWNSDIKANKIGKI